MALGVALGACGGEPLTDDLGETASATDPWGWCVDHPCPNYEVINYGGCPFDDGLLLVGVKNVGTLAAPYVTRTHVEFRYSTSKLVVDDHDITTEPLSAGGSKVVWIPAPAISRASCRTRLCRWKVIADADDYINEVDGTNNILGGTCWFP
jgi:hypothetical protein